MSKIIALVENTSSSPEFPSKHGLCLYIETEKHKILFDLGMDDLFIENAMKKNIDISEIDAVIISHGHIDHGVGLKYFLDLNSKAKIYIRKEAFESHYIKVIGIPFNVGIDKEYINSNQIIFSNEVMQIDEELFLFSDVRGDSNYSRSNKALYTRKHSKFLRDDFLHEQNLIINDNGKRILISGCSHAGIVNIQNKAEKLLSHEIETVIGGFHLYNPPTRKYESNEIIDNIAKTLLITESEYYTCHCTGIKAYNRMKGMLGERLKYLSTGMEIKL